MIIGQHKINFPFFLAPMVGLSHVVLRNRVRKYLPAGAKTFWPTEMLSSRRIPYQTLGSTPETLLAENDGFLVPQILANEERFIKDSIEKLEAWGVVGVDINMGCPVDKALRHNYGVALMGDSDYAAEIVRMAVRYTKLPVSVKLRSGFEQQKHLVVNFCQKLEQAGAHYLTVHPRSAEQKRRGTPDWEQIRQIKSQLSIPLIGNGDIHSAQEALEKMAVYGADGIMIGRALAAKPWMFWQLGHALGFDNPQGLTGLPPLDGAEEAEYFKQNVVDYLTDCFFYFEEWNALRKFRFFIRTIHGWLNYGHQLYRISQKYDNFQDLSFHLQAFFKSDDLVVAQTTSLN